MYQYANKLQHKRFNSDINMEDNIKSMSQAYLVTLNTITLLEIDQQWLLIDPRELKLVNIIN
jgi:hypothetical protein